MALTVAGMSILTPARRPLVLPETSKRILRRPSAQGLLVPNMSGAPLSGDEIDYDELTIVRQWREYEPDAPGEVRYMCYELEQLNPGAKQVDRFFKAVRMIRLTRVPRYLRQHATTEQFRDLLSGLREKKVLFVNLIAKSPTMPLVFAYGVQGVGETMAEAMERADDAFAALSVSLDGTYQQLEYKPLSLQEGELLARYQTTWRHIAMARGRPMPESAGIGASAVLDGNRTDVQATNDAIASFVRGMGDKSFMLSMVTVPLTPEDMSHAWRNISMKLSAVRSDQQGSRSVGASFSLPLGLGASLSDSSSNTHSTTGTTGVGSSDGVSATFTEGLSVSETQGTSTSQSVGTSASDTTGTSQSATVGTSTSQGTSTSATESEGTSQSESQGLSVSSSASTSDTVSAGASTGTSASQADSVTSGASTSASQSESQSTSDSTSHTASVGQSTSVSESQSLSQGQTNSMTVGTSNTQGTSTSLTQTQGVNASQSLGQSNSASSNWSQSAGQSLSAGQTLTENWSKQFTESLSEALGLSTSRNDSTSGSAQQGGSASINGGLPQFGLGAGLGESWVNGVGGSLTEGSGESLTHTNGASSGTSAGGSLGNSLTHGTNVGQSAGGSVGQTVTGTNTVGQSQSVSTGQSLSASHTESASQSTALSNTATHGVSQTQGVSQSQSLGTGHTTSQGTGQSVTQGLSAGTGQTLTQGVSAGTNAGMSQGSSQGTSQGASSSTGAGTSQGTSVGVGTNAGTGTSQSATAGTSQSHTTGTSATQGTGTSQSSTQGASTSVAQGASTAQSSTQAVSDAWMVAMARGQGQSGSFGVVPGLNATITKATFDEAKRALGDVLEAQMRRYHDGIEGGGMLYQMFLVTEDSETLSGATALLKAAFWGPGGADKGRLVQPFHTVVIEDDEEADRLLTHAAALTHYRKREPVVELIEPHMFSSYVTTGEAAVFSAPPTSEALGLMAQTDSMPVFAMPANRMDRDLFLGHVVDGERGRVTNVRFGVDLSELTHIAVQGVTGMGKTSTMMRLLEQAAQREVKVTEPPTFERPFMTESVVKPGILCFDWMNNMRDLATLVEPERFQLFSVSKPELGAFRWNPLEIPHPGIPAQQWLGAQADQLAASFGLGEYGRSLLAEQINDLYLANRLEPFTLRQQVVDPDTGVVLQPALTLPAVPRGDLPAGAIRLDAAGNEVANVETCAELSRLVSLEHVAVKIVALVEQMATQEGARAMGTAMRDRVQSVWRRIQYYAPGGPLAEMVAADPDLRTRECLGVRDIIDADRGLVTVVETDGLDQGNRRVILGSIMLAVYRYGLHVGKGAFDNNGRGPGTFLVLEEAHELFGTTNEGEDDSSVKMRANLYESMFRRARQTGLRLVVMTQNIGAIPASITSQTTTVITHRTYDSPDRGRLCDLFSWDKGPLGQLREIRYLGEMPRGYALVRLDARDSYLESAPVQILVDPPTITPASDALLAELAQTRAQRFARQ